MTSTFSPTLKGRKEAAAGTMSSHFDKPQGFQCRAGQYVSLTLIDPPETDAPASSRGVALGQL